MPHGPLKTLGPQLRECLPLSSCRTLVIQISFFIETLKDKVRNLRLSSEYHICFTCLRTQGCEHIERVMTSSTFIHLTDGSVQQWRPDFIIGLNPAREIYPQIKRRGQITIIICRKWCAIAVQYMTFLCSCEAVFTISQMMKSIRSESALMSKGAVYLQCFPRQWLRPCGCVLSWLTYIPL